MLPHQHHPKLKQLLSSLFHIIYIILKEKPRLKLVDRSVIAIFRWDIESSFHVLRSRVPGPPKKGRDVPLFVLVSSVYIFQLLGTVFLNGRFLTNVVIHIFVYCDLVNCLLVLFWLPKYKLIYFLIHQFNQFNSMITVHCKSHDSSYISRVKFEKCITSVLYYS